MIAWLNVIVFSRTLFVVNNNSKRERGKQTVETARTTQFFNKNKNGYRNMYICWHDTSLIYWLILLLLLLLPLYWNLPVFCCRHTAADAAVWSLRLVILRAHLSFNKKNSKAEKNHAFRWQASSSLTCSSVLEMRATLVGLIHSVSQSVTHSHAHTLTSIKINSQEPSITWYIFGILSSSVCGAHTLTNGVKHTQTHKHVHSIARFNIFVIYSIDIIFLFSSTVGSFVCLASKQLAFESNEIWS